MIRQPHPVHGISEPGFEPLRDALQRALINGDELGASLAVVVDGELVVDLWAGHQDRARMIPWTRDTIVNVWSLTKPATALAALSLVDSGQIELDQPVAEYWPEFAAHGKENVTVRQVLSHTSGVPGWRPPLTLGDFYDHNKACQLLAEQPPRWEAGSVGAYHAQNYGHLIGEIIRRITGQSLKATLKERVSDPLGVDFQLGAAVTEFSRVAELDAPARTPMPFPDHLDRAPMVDTFTAPIITAADAQTPQWRAAELGAVNGHSNARALATMFSAFAQDGLANGHRLFGADTAASAIRPHSEGVDHVLGLPLRWGLGLALADEGNPARVPPGDRLFWGGWGGSIAVIDPSARMTFTYTMNKMSPGVIGSDRSIDYVETLYGCLSSLERS